MEENKNNLPEVNAISKDAEQPEGNSTNRDSNEPEHSSSAPTRTLWGDAWRRLRSNKLAVIASVWLLIIVVIALTADLWVPQHFGSPTETDSSTMTSNSRLPPPGNIRLVRTRWVVTSFVVSFMGRVYRFR